MEQEERIEEQDGYILEIDGVPVFIPYREG